MYNIKATRLGISSYSTMYDFIHHRGVTVSNACNTEIEIQTPQSPITLELYRAGLAVDSTFEDVAPKLFEK